MIVILEGINKTGKTTVANFLANEGFLYINDDTCHNVLPNIRKHFTQGGIYAYLTMFKSIQEQMPSVNVVVDRFHLTEYVYGVAERGYSATYVFDVDKLLAGIGGVKLVMMDHSDVESVNQRAEKDLTYHAKLYDLVYADSVIEKRVYNLKDNISSLMEWLADDKKPLA